MNAALLPPSQIEDALYGLSRILIIAGFASIVAQMGWIKIGVSRKVAALIWLGGSATGAIGVWMALTIAALTLDNADLYILNRDISGSGLLGAALGCNIVPLASAIALISRENR